MTEVITHAPPTLTTEQDDAVSQIVDWFMAEDGKQTFRLHGYAGTGKTTVLREVVDRLYELSPNVRIHFAAPTGKAAKVMRSKGLPGATTLHTSGLIWSYKTSRRTGRKYPHPLGKGEAGLDEIDLLVIDECSMVRKDLAARILYHPDPKNLFEPMTTKGGKRESLRVLAVGDPAQLWPIPEKGDAAEPSPWAKEGKHQARLETVHRSVEGSPVLEAANAVRGPDGMDLGAMWKLAGVGSDIEVPALLAVDQVIAYQNETRWHIIKLIRKAKGLPEGVPVKGDQLVLLRNTNDLVNGEQFEVGSAERHAMTAVEGQHGEFDYFRVSLTDGRTVNVAACSLEGPEGERRGVSLSSKADVLPMTFADAITCHKAQGSEWDSVLVVDEGYMSRQSEGWHYTALTRARSWVGIVEAEDLPTGWSLNEAKVIRDRWYSAVWDDGELTDTVKVTALALADMISDRDTIRASVDVAGLAEQIDRKVSTVQTHMTTLRKAGYLSGKAGLTMLSFPCGIKPPSRLEQLHALMVRQALPGGAEVS